MTNGLGWCRRTGRDLFQVDPMRRVHVVDYAWASGDNLFPADEVVELVTWERHSRGYGGVVVDPESGAFCFYLDFLYRGDG